MLANTPNTINYVEFPAQSAVARSKRFFSEAFGWTWKDYGDEYADTHSSGVSSGLNGTTQRRPAQPLVVLYITDLEQACDKVIAAGGTITDDNLRLPGRPPLPLPRPSGNELGAWSETPETHA
jgi:uncharacterized protein